MGTVEQIEQLVRIAQEFGRDIANGKEAREIYRIGSSTTKKPCCQRHAQPQAGQKGFAPNRLTGREEAYRSSRLQHA